MATASVLSFLSLFISFAQGHRILVTSVGVAASQNFVMGRVADILGANGHNVTLLRWVMFPETKSTKLQHSIEITYNMWDSIEMLDYFRTTTQTMGWEENGSPVQSVQATVRLFNLIKNGCERLLGDQDMISKLSADKYDVVIIHDVDLCIFGLTRVLGIKRYAWFTTAFMLDPIATLSGTPAPYSFVPSAAHIATDTMKFNERIQNLFMTSFVHGMFAILVSQYTNLFREHYGEQFPPMDQLLQESQLIYTNSDHFFEYPRPTQYNVIHVGGLTMTKPEPLNEEWQGIVSRSRPAGLVLFSLGSLVNTTGMPIKYKQLFLNVFKRFPDYTFIFRLEGELPDSTDVSNVLFPEWIPQKGLLASSRLKCFITHGGYNSLSEASFFGVPIVVLPLVGDQAANGKRVERKNIGRILDKNNLTEQNVHHILNQVLNSKKIQSNSVRLSKAMRSKPVAAADLIVESTESAAKLHINNRYTKPASLKLGFIQYYMIDILTFLCLLVFSSLYG